MSQPTWSATRRKFLAQFLFAWRLASMFLSQFLCRSSHLLALRHLLQAISISSGKAGVNFFTQIKTVTQQWKDLPSGTGANLAMPTSKV
ncbi:hypothetical protein ACB092_11G181400 [Castanea dentata]